MREQQRLEIAPPPEPVVHELLRLPVAEVDVVAAAAPLPPPLRPLTVRLVVGRRGGGRGARPLARAVQQLAVAARLRDAEDDAGGRDGVHETRLAGVWGKETGVTFRILCYIHK